MDWTEVAKGLGAVGPSAFAVWVLYRYARGGFISLREHNETLERIRHLEADKAALIKSHHAETEAHRETRDTLREAVTQNGMLVTSAALATEVMRAIDKTAGRGA